MFAAGLWLVRSQVTVNDVDYMEGMIPHHSIAILTSERAGIRDMRVAELAGEIIEAQRREIREMEWLIADIRDNGPALSRDDLEKGLFQSSRILIRGWPAQGLDLAVVSGTAESSIDQATK